MNIRWKSPRIFCSSWQISPTNALEKDVIPVPSIQDNSLEAYEYYLGVPKMMEAIDICKLNHI